MKRLLTAVITALLLLCGTAASATPATAAGSAPATCTRYDANKPVVDYINEQGQSILYASGGIGACSKPGSVAGTVTAQHFEGGIWVTKGTVMNYAGSWGALYRFARQASNAVTDAACEPGKWRTHVTRDDVTTTPWNSAVSTFVAGEGPGSCYYGGGD